MIGETYHLAPAAHFHASDPARPYMPETFAADGFTHCTDGLDQVLDTANRYYRGDPRQFVLLTIDKARVEAEIRYEDVAAAYPHIYGPLNRDAIVRVVPVPRTADGRFGKGAAESGDQKS